MTDGTTVGVKARAAHRQLDSLSAVSQERAKSAAAATIVAAPPTSCHVTAHPDDRWMLGSSWDFPTAKAALMYAPSRARTQPTKASCPDDVRNRRDNRYRHADTPVAVTMVPSFLAWSGWTSSSA